MRDSRRGSMEPTRDARTPVRLDPYDPCEIDPPSTMFIRLGVALAIVFLLLFLARPLLTAVR